MLFITLQPNASNLDAWPYEIVFVPSHESLPLWLAVSNSTFDPSHRCDLGLSGLRFDLSMKILASEANFAPHHQLGVRHKTLGS
jgi:hypothetical protein